MKLIKRIFLLAVLSIALWSCNNSENKNSSKELPSIQEVDNSDPDKHKGITAQLSLLSEESKDITLEKIKRLTNGVLASDTDFQDGEWLSFQDDKVVIQYEWSEMQSISAIDFRLRNDFNEGIYTPRSISFRLSKDGKTYPYGSRIARFDVTQKLITKTLELGKPKDAKFLRIEIVTYGKIKDDLPKAGEQTWTYLDEIMIQ